MPITYDATLVMLSVFIAITGALTGLTLSTGYNQRTRRSYASSLINGAIVIGGSIWAMHFIAMLAVRLPVPVSYNFIDTMLSLYAAVIGTGFGLFIVSRRRLGALSVPVGGLLMGAAIGGMHYLGMHAMRGCGLAYEQAGVIASIGIAVAASSIALWFTFRKRGAAETLLGGLVLGLAIASMHYTAMIATTFQPLAISYESAAPLLSQDVLAFIIASVTFGICGLFLLLFSSLALGNDGTVHGRR